MQSAATFVNGFLDSELNLEVPALVEPVSSGKSRVAILCSPLYSRSANLQDCVHWIPGWRGQDLPDTVNKEKLVESIIADSTDKNNQKINELTLRSQRETSEVMVLSLRDEIERMTVQRDNLQDLLKDLWDQFQVIAKPTLCDGDCGVHMAVAFGENVPLGVLSGADAAPEDTLQIVAAYRAEIAAMWRSAADDILWQQVWQRFIEGRLDLRHWQELASPVITTPPKKRRKSMSTTPPGKKSAAKKCRGVLMEGDGVEVDVDEVSVQIGTEEKEAAEKPKRPKPTGKKLPAEKSITLTRAVKDVLSERNLRYQLFLQFHREKSHVLVFPGRVGNWTFGGDGGSFWNVLDGFAMVGRINLLVLVLVDDLEWWPPMGFWAS